MNIHKNILAITYWGYSDALIQTYTLPYIRIILELLPANSKIYLVTLEKENYGSQIEVEPGIINIRYQYSGFGLSASLLWMKNIFSLKKLIQTSSINTIHAFCTPAGMIGYILSKLTSIPLILDSYEPHAEAMVENGEWKKNSASFRLLFYFEKKQSIHAKKIIAATKQMQEYAFEKYKVKRDDLFVKPACVDLEKFNTKFKKDTALVNELKLQNKIVCVYAGKFGGIYLKEEVFEFYKACYQFWKENFVVLLLTNNNIEEINSLILKYDLPKSIFRIQFVPHSLINKYIGLGDFAITPVKPVPTKKYCTPIKNGEYWAMGLPVVIPPGISVDSDIIHTNNIGYVLKELNYAEYEAAIKKTDELIKDKTISEKIRAVAKQERDFSIAIKIYKTIYS